MSKFKLFYVRYGDIFVTVKATSKIKAEDLAHQCLVENSYIKEGQQIFADEVIIVPHGERVVSIQEY